MQTLTAILPRRVIEDILAAYFAGRSLRFAVASLDAGSDVAIGEAWVSPAGARYRLSGPTARVLRLLSLAGDISLR